MASKVMSYVDTIAAFGLLIWVGMASSLYLLTIPSILSTISDCSSVDLILSKIVVRLDFAAWIAFGMAMALVQGTRLLFQISERELISSMRLWSAAVMLALLTCFTSTFIVSPKMHFANNYYKNDVGTSYQQVSLINQKAYNITNQLVKLRILLALSLTAGIILLPRQKKMNDLR